MKYSEEIRQELFRVGRMSARAGQSMTSLLVGIAIMGTVGVAAAKLTQSTHTQEQSLSAKNGAAELMDTIADEIRTQTRYSDLAGKYGGTGESGTGWKTLDSNSADEFIVRTTVRKICNDAPSTNCDATHVDIEIVDKGTGEVVLKQTVTRVYTHFYEPVVPFTSSQTRDLPVDTIAIRYTSDGAIGNDGSTHTAYGYDLKINSEACPYDYMPNGTSPRPNGCVRCPDGDWKQYHNGDCTLGRCPIGQKANAAKNGCEAITCSSGEVLNGDNCVVKSGCSSFGSRTLSGFPSSEWCTFTWYPVAMPGQNLGFGSLGSIYTIPKKVAAQAKWYNGSNAGISCGSSIIGIQARSNGLVLNGRTHRIGISCPFVFCMTPPCPSPVCSVSYPSQLCW